MPIRLRTAVATCLVVAAASSVHAVPIGAPVAADQRRGQEIMVCGQFYNAGTPVVLWTDPGGYDFSQRRVRPPRSTTQPVGRRSGRATTMPATSIGGASSEPTSTASTGPTSAAATEPTSGAELMRSGLPMLRGGDLTLDQVRPNVDQFVIHFDNCGTSRECFRVLVQRGLAVQLMCDIDGTIYQTMDLRNSAPHATIANTRSIGCETANMGGVGIKGPIPPSLAKWYAIENGQPRITIPPAFGDGGIRTPNFVGHPARPQPVIGNVNGDLSRQYDFTPQQYQALAQMAATLCTIFPKIQPDFPRQRTQLGLPTTGPTTSPVAGDPTTLPTALADPEEPGILIPHALTRAQFDTWQGVIGHYHVQTEKDDPGPAFQWIPFIERVRSIMSVEARATNKRYRHQPVVSRPTPAPTTTATPAATIGPVTQPSSMQTASPQ